MRIYCLLCSKQKRMIEQRLATTNLIILQNLSYIEHQSQNQCRVFVGAKRRNKLGAHIPSTARLVSNCVKLVSVPPIPWSRCLSEARLFRVDADIQDIDYKKSEQKMSVKFKKGALDHELWNVFVFNNLSEIKEFGIWECPPVPLYHLQLLNSLKTLFIGDCSGFFWPTKGESGNDARFEFLVEHLVIYNWGASWKELSQLITYFSNLSTLELSDCDNKHAGGAEEIEAAAGRQLPLPIQLKELLENQSSLRSLTIRDCPMLLSSSLLTSSYCPSSYCPFPTSLQSLEIWGVKDGMLTLAPLTNLTTLVIEDCGGLRFEYLWHLLAQGHLKDLEIRGAHNLLDVPEPLRICRQDLPQHSSKMQALETEGEAGETVVVPISGHFTSSLTKLALGQKHDMEHFTVEQSEALQLLTSLQLLHIGWCNRLQSLQEGLIGLPNLKRLEIWFCGSLRSLPKGGLPSSLVELHFEECNAFQSLTNGSLPSSLTELCISDCSAFRSLPKERLPSSLRILSITCCPAIRSLHERFLPSALQMLDVQL